MIRLDFGGQKKKVKGSGTKDSRKIILIMVRFFLIEPSISQGLYLKDWYYNISKFILKLFLY